ncbi:MAG: NYN domain-containing protein [Phycisphaerales bacterium]|nr:MAG: NYN domain-containing protein [Phycisphaerales bacterium]
MPYVIDGTNLLWAIQESHEECEIAGEVQLCLTLDRYFALVGDAGEIVFDGAGPPDKSIFDAVAHLDVIFSGFSSDADSVIEEKVLANTAPRRLTVVSSDRRLRKAAGERKATALKSELFWNQVLKELSRKKPAEKEPEEKRDGLTEGETKQWLDLFGLED